MFEPSRYQQAVFDFVRHGEGHLVVRAAAGAGKSTTLVEAFRFLNGAGRLLFAAFNRHIQEELATRLRAIGSEAECKTIHQIGRGVLAAGWSGNLRKEDRKYRTLVREYLMNWSMANARNVDTAKNIDTMTKLVDFARLTLTDARNVDKLLELIVHFGLDVDFEDDDFDVIMQGVPKVIEEGIAQYQRAGIIDFTDMIYLPNVLRMSLPKYDWIFVDEAQDLNAAQLELVMGCIKKSGRLVFVGDEHQAIQGFAGADCYSLQKIIDRTKATVLPLSVCYRCPKLHVDLARSIVGDDIEASPYVGEGQVVHLTEDKFSNVVRPGDLVLCRCTAPLVEQCLALLRKGIPARIRGRDLGASFTSLLKKLKKRPGFALSLVAGLAEEYRNEQVQVLKQLSENELQLASLYDKVDTFLCLYKAYMSQEDIVEKSIQGFEAYIETFFSDVNEKQVVMFSTVHRAKGLEYPRVFVLRPDLMPHPAAKQGWQQVQEHNIKYVAWTRVKYKRDNPESGYLALVGQMSDGDAHLVKKIGGRAKETITEIVAAEEPPVRKEPKKTRQERPKKDVRELRQRIDIRLPQSLLEVMDRSGIDRTELIERAVQQYLGIED